MLQISAKAAQDGARDVQTEARRVCALGEGPEQTRRIRYPYARILKPYDNVTRLYRTADR